jgi:quinol monooxygenase YgiN
MHGRYRNFEVAKVGSEMESMMAVIRTTRFEVAPADVEDMIARRNALVAAVRNAFPGLTQARLARVGEQVWIDSWRWESAASLDAALQAAATGALPEARPVFALTERDRGVGGDRG